MTDSQIVARYYKGARTILSPVSATPTITWAAQLVFSPGYYQYNSGVYDLTQPGLYELTHYATSAQNWSNTTHMVVSDSSGDPTALLSAAAELAKWGYSDNGLTTAQLSAQARTSPLRMLCGPLHAWVKAGLLDPAGVTSRIAFFLTVGPSNGFEDGHQAIEVTIGGNRVLHDVSNGMRFADASTGALLSARDAVTAIAAGSFSYDDLGGGQCAGEVSPASPGFDVTAYYRANLSRAGDLLAWHQRIFQAVGLQSGSEVWWKLPPGAPAGASTYITGLSSAYVVKDAATWNAAFY